MRLSSACVTAVAVLVGCANFDQESQIEDTRVLAVVTEPPEILYSPLFLTPAAQRPFAPPPIEVNLRVHAFDPRGGRHSLSVQMCPEGAGDQTCRLYDAEADIAKEPPAAQAQIRALLTPKKETGRISDDAQPVGKMTPDRFTYTFTPEVIDFFIPDDEDGNPIPNVFPLLPRFVVVAESLDRKASEVREERAFKRIPLALDLTSPQLPPDVVAQLAESLGLTLCTAENDPLTLPEEDFLEEESPCLSRRVPNTNPQLTGFKIEKDAEKPTEEYLYDPAPTLARNSLLVADPGAEVTITPAFIEGTVEKYQVLSFDIEESRIVLLNRREDFACEWFSTRGTVSSDETALQFSNSLAVTWTLPADAKKGDLDSIYLVVLDQRGGTAFAQVTARYR